MSYINPIPPALTPQDITRFWSKVNKEGPVIRPGLGPCWIWTASTQSQGYPLFSFSTNRRLKDGRPARQVLVHRLSFFLHSGIWSTVYVCHHCDNPLCMRPEHLFEGTNKQNMEDAARKGRTASGNRNGTRLHPDKMRRGEQVTASKLTTQQVIEIRTRYAQRQKNQRELAEEYGIHAGTVSEIITRKIWVHV